MDYVSLFQNYIDWTDFKPLVNFFTCW